MTTPLLQGLDPDCRLGDLPTHASEVHANAPSHVLEQALRDQPGLPGVIVTHHGRFQGMLSRRRCHESLSMAFGREVFLERPVRVLLEANRAEPLCLGPDTRIEVASREGLSRPMPDTYEPIVVMQEDGTARLLDMQVLLLALSRILGLKNDEHEHLLKQMRESNRELKETLDKLRRTQQSLVEAEKMASLSQLVAGVAHEVNTPVGITLTAASHLQEQLQHQQHLFDTDQLRRAGFRRFLTQGLETTEFVLSNVQRAAQLIRSFQKVAVDQVAEEHQTYALREYLGHIVTSARPRLKRAGHDVVIDCPESLHLRGFPGALSQVLTNLLINSVVHAYPDGRAGRIIIQAREKAEERVELRYADDGKGIPPAIRQRIFEPFFTTNRAAGGTGLGLHIAYNIVTQSLRGKIEVVSESRRGTTFVLHFPKRLPSDDRPGSAARSNIARPYYAAPSPGRI